MTSLENLPVLWAGPQAVVTLPREIDISNAGQVSDTLLGVLDRGVSALVADMTGTSFCACAGVSALARAQRCAAARQARLRVATTTPIVLRVLALTGADRLVPVFGTVADALAGPSGLAPSPEDAGDARNAGDTRGENENPARVARA
jgi:anti-sigma B factor antagonist